MQKDGDVCEFDQMQQSASTNQENMGERRVSPVRSKSVPSLNRSGGTPASENRSRSSSPSKKLLSGNVTLLQSVATVFYAQK